MSNNSLVRLVPPTNEREIYRDDNLLIYWNSSNTGLVIRQKGCPVVNIQRTQYDAWLRFTPNTLDVIHKIIRALRREEYK